MADVKCSIAFSSSPVVKETKTKHTNNKVDGQHEQSESFVT